MKSILLALGLTLAGVVQAEQLDVFVFKKSYNPQNILHYAVTVDADCKLASTVKPYWVMGNGSIEGLTSRETRVYSPTVTHTTAQKSELTFTIGAFDELEAHISNPEIRVQASKAASGKCTAHALMNIDSRDIILKEAYTSGHFTVLMSWKTNYVTITGKNLDGSAFSKTINP